MSKEKTTLQAIAHSLGVSIATVSRVLNSHPNVKEETRKKIIPILLENGYNLYHNAVNEHSKTIAVLVPGLANPFTTLVINGIRKAANTHHLNTVIVPCKENDNPSVDYFLKLLSDMNIRGIISMIAFPNKEIATSLAQFYPLVMCAEHIEDNAFSFVTIDDVSAGQQATDYLIQLGRRNLVLLNSSLNHKYARHREQGFRKAIEQNGLTLKEEHIIHIPLINYQMAYSQIYFLLSKNPQIDGIFACSDIYAAACVQAAIQTNRNIPKDISIVGFDNIELASIVSPKLTTIDQPSFELGYQALEVLYEKIINTNDIEKQITLYTNLIVRETT